MYDFECTVCCDDSEKCYSIKNKKEVEKNKMNNRMSKDGYYLEIALAVSNRSTCLKRHYGAIIVKDDRIVATGYNGSPRGEINCCDRGECQRPNAQRYSDYNECPAVHAEQNAMLSASHEQLNGATLYLACDEIEQEIGITHGMPKEDKNPTPCGLCKRMIQNSGIKRVVNKSGEIIWG